MDSINFEKLKNEGKTVIYKDENEKVEEKNGWRFWGERETPNEHVYVYRKIVTFEEAYRYKAENYG